MAEIGDLIMGESRAVLKVLRGVIVNYRTGTKTQRQKEYIVQFAGVKSANQAARLLNRKVAWPVGERKIRGKIVAVHGKNGLVRPRFRKGLPGKTGIQIEIIGWSVYSLPNVMFSFSNFFKR